jgi:hypothetical protein
MTKYACRRSLVSGFAIFLLLLCLAGGQVASAKTTIDFNPELNFSKFKTFAYIGGVEQLMMQQLNPELINNRIHRMVTEELTKLGLREVKPDEHPDLVVRYWAMSQSKINVASTGNWGPWGPYIGDSWGMLFDTMDATATREGKLIIDLIDTNGKDLAWRLYLSRRLSNPDKDWDKGSAEIRKAFQEHYPPSDKDKAAKREERAKQAAKK